MVFLERLASADPGVVRVAAADLARAAGDAPDLRARAGGAIAAALSRARDERTTVSLCRSLAAVGGLSDLGPLRALIHDRATPPRAAHAAVIAFDTIEARAGAPGPVR